MAIKWYLSPQATNWEKYWEKTSIEDEVRNTEDDYPPMLAAVKNNAKKDECVLDGGCGLGRWLLYLGKQGYTNLIGVDFISPPLKLINDNNKDITTKIGSVDELPIEDASVDLYLSMGVVEHFEEGPGKALSEANRVLRSGGKMVLSVPYQNYYRSTIRRIFTMPLLKLLKPAFRNKNRIFYQYYYSKKDLRAFLEKANFEVLDSFYYDRFHTKHIRIGLCLEFPFLRNKAGKAFELNRVGRVISRFSEAISKGIFSSNITFVAKKR